MPSTTRKRALQQADSNAASQPNPKVLKTIPDGKENEAANAWYETLTVKELKQLCKERPTRGVDSCPNRLMLAE